VRARARARWTLVPLVRAWTHTAKDNSRGTSHARLMFFFFLFFFSQRRDGVGDDGDVTLRGIVRE